MTYLTFLLIFLIGPIIALAVAHGRRFGRQAQRAAARAIGLVAAIAFLYTTPWDNFLVYSDVWGYGADRVLATIGYVPVEEYLFFLLQPVLTGLVFFHLGGHELRLPDTRVPGRSAGVLLFGLLTVLGVFFLFLGGSALYAGLILAWASPVCAGLWAFGIDAVQRTWRPALAALLIASLYLWSADAIAIRLGIWTIYPATSFEIEPLGLPIEEAIFFFQTNVLVILGVICFRHGELIGRGNM